MIAKNVLDIAGNVRREVRLVMLDAPNDRSGVPWRSPGAAESSPSAAARDQVRARPRGPLARPPGPRARTHPKTGPTSRVPQRDQSPCPPPPPLPAAPRCASAQSVAIPRQGFGLRAPERDPAPDLLSPTSRPPRTPGRLRSDRRRKRPGPPRSGWTGSPGSRADWRSPPSKAGWRQPRRRPGATGRYAPSGHARGRPSMQNAASLPSPLAPPRH